MYREEFRNRCHSCIGSRGLKGGPFRPPKSAFLPTWEGPGDPGIGWLLTLMNIPPIGPALGASRSPHHLTGTERPAYSYPVLWQFVVSDKKKGFRTRGPDPRPYLLPEQESPRPFNCMGMGGMGRGKNPPFPIYLV